MSILQVNGADIPAPKPFKVTISDIDMDSDSDANGNLHRNRINVKRKLPLEWGPLSWQEISQILTSVKDVFFDCKYPDPQTGKYEVKRMYVGDRTAAICVEQDDGSLMWEGLTMDFVEK